MVVVVLEANVDKTQWENLKEAYRNAGADKPAHLLESFLIQNKTNPEKWQALTIWSSIEALEEYRATVTTPAGILIFRSIGAEPTFTLYDVHGTLK